MNPTAERAAHITWTGIKALVFGIGYPAFAAYTTYKVWTVELAGSIDNGVLTDFGHHVFATLPLSIVAAVSLLCGWKRALSRRVSPFQEERFGEAARLFLVPAVLVVVTLALFNVGPTVVEIAAPIAIVAMLIGGAFAIAAGPRAVTPH